MKEQTKNISGKHFNEKDPCTRHGLTNVFVSLLLCFGIVLLGVIYNKSGAITPKTSGIMLLVSGLSPLILTLLFMLVNFLIGKKFEKMGENVTKMRDYLMSHRENAEESAKKELSRLLRIRFFTILWAVFIGASAFCFAFFLGTSPLVTDLSVPFTYYSALLFYCSLWELRRYTPAADPAPKDNELTETDYPELHALVRRAEEHIGSKETFRIFIFDDAYSPVGVGMNDDSVEIYIDVVALNLLTEEELYAILLHEFTHVNSRSAKDKAIGRYALYLEERPYSSSVFFRVEKYVYQLFHNLFGLHYMLYSFASSIEKECYADRMMLECPQAAAAALLKIRYYEFSYEERAYDDEIAPFFLPESPTETNCSDIVRQFHKVFPSRRDFWNRLIEKEILSRSASHPTIISRIRALGLEELPIVTEFPSGDWQKLCEKALKAADLLIHDSFEKGSPGYQEQRRTAYLEPLNTVTEWEEKGRPLVAEEYADVMIALFRVGRTADAIAFAERAIDKLPPAASHTAYFERGRYRLNKYDAAGLDDLYTAMAENNNYIEDGLDLIGSFCCKTGMQEELDTYREKAIQLLQKYSDESMKDREISQKDRLSPEHLPEGALEGILKYIESVSEGNVEKVYLFRKTVSESYFSSAVVLKLIPGVHEKNKEEILHRVFRYLDTSSDWQYSLYEYADIPAGILEKTPEYLVWQKPDAAGEDLSEKS